MGTSTAERLTTIEVRMAYVDKQVDELDALVRTALDRMEAIEATLVALREQAAVAAVRGDPEAEVPPHHDRL